ncbi:MAG: 2OG-Fe(II) oxygenase family protein [Nostoc sp.]|uniref:2OG-Fe(II) oxygenase family protein n=1 Tax=Nostoc sp. TaxID=1180 RepID=UPI002FFBB9B0
MLDLDTIAKATMQSVPYPWAYLENFLPESESLELANSYPKSGFYQERGSLFPVRMVYDEIQEWNKPLITSPPKLNDLWQELVEDLRSTAYRAALGELTGLNLMDDLMFIYLFRYEKENTFPPHTDTTICCMVQMFYFNQQWNPSWGGCLRILKSDQAKDVYQQISPRLNTSIIFVNSDHSWHTVTPVLPEATQSRLALKVAFIKQEEYLKQMGGK